MCFSHDDDCAAAGGQDVGYACPAGNCCIVSSDTDTDTDTELQCEDVDSTATCHFDVDGPSCSGAGVLVEGACPEDWHCCMPEYAIDPIPNTEECADDEVLQEGTNLCWKRCPIGQMWWSGENVCLELTLHMDWCTAYGPHTEYIVNDTTGEEELYEICITSPEGIEYPAGDACGREFGAHYRLPTVEEFSILYNESKVGAMDGTPPDWYDGKAHPGGWTSTFHSLKTSSYNYTKAWYAQIDSQLLTATFPTGVAGNGQTTCVHVL